MPAALFREWSLSKKARIAGVYGMAKKVEESRGG
jgi:hypothetical protein